MDDDPLMAMDDGAAPWFMHGSPEVVDHADMMEGSPSAAALGDLGLALPDSTLGHQSGMAGPETDTGHVEEGITPLRGPGLMQLLQAASADCDRGLAVGTRVWGKVRGFCLWPGVVWHPSLVKRADLADLLRSYAPGAKLVHFYGEHNCSWCTSVERCAPLVSRGEGLVHDPEAAVQGPQSTVQGSEGLADPFQAGSGAHTPQQRAQVPAAADGAAATAHEFTALQEGHVMLDDSDRPGIGQTTEAAAQGAGEGVEDGEPLLKAHHRHLEAMREWGKQNKRPKLVSAALWELDGCVEEGGAEVCRVLRLSEAWGPSMQDPVCGCCGEDRAEVVCQSCGRAAHTLCLFPPALDKYCLPTDRPWACPKCGAENKHGKVYPPGVLLGPDGQPIKKKRGRPPKVKPADPAAAATASADAEEEGGGRKKGKGGAGSEPDKDRLGLTPDWIIYTVCHFIFGLPKPQPGIPYIPGLLDPCSNNKLAPNLPAEKLYDAQDNGLLLKNEWAGYCILLNPDYRSQTQWRFVNRAMDEVESGNVPAILLLCRNSTDAAYFQRLRPYPRVLLRRNSAHFKDYDRTTPGFGIAAILLASPDKTDLYTRFHQGFSHAGEASIPIDATFMSSTSFRELCARLKLQARHQQRDHWVQCCQCSKWRIIPYNAVLSLGDESWQCAMLRPPHSNCRTALTRTEQLGMAYAHGAADGANQGGSNGEVMGIPVWHQSGAAGKKTNKAAALPALPAPADTTSPPPAATRRSQRKVAKIADTDPVPGGLPVPDQPTACTPDADPATQTDAAPAQPTAAKATGPAVSPSPVAVQDHNQIIPKPDTSMGLPLASASVSVEDADAASRKPAASRKVVGTFSTLPQRSPPASAIPSAAMPEGVQPLPSQGRTAPSSSAAPNGLAASLCLSQDVMDWCAAHGIRLGTNDTTTEAPAPFGTAALTAAAMETEPTVTATSRTDVGTAAELKQEVDPEARPEAQNTPPRGKRATRLPSKLLDAEPTPTKRQSRPAARAAGQYSSAAGGQATANLVQMLHQLSKLPGQQATVELDSSSGPPRAAKPAEAVDKLATAPVVSSTLPAGASTGPAVPLIGNKGRATLEERQKLMMIASQNPAGADPTLATTHLSALAQACTQLATTLNHRLQATEEVRGQESKVDAPAGGCPGCHELMEAMQQLQVQLAEVLAVLPTTSQQYN